jgi:hypothetical protein
MTDALPKPLDKIKRTKDPAERAREAVAFIARAEAQAKQGRDLRDDAIREMRATGTLIREIVERTGVNVHTVKAVLR